MPLELDRRSFTKAAAVVAGAAFALAPQQAHAVTSAEKQAEVQQVASQLESINSEFETAVQQYNKAQDDYNNATNAVEECEEKISAAQEKIGGLQGRLETRATSMYRNGSMSYLDVLLGTASFADFATVWDTLNNLNENDADLVSQAKAAKQELENTQEELAANQQAAKTAVAEANSYKATVEQKQSEYTNLYDSLSSEYQQLLEQEQAERDRAAAAAAAAYTPTVTQESSSSSSSSSSGSSSSGSSSSSSSGGYASSSSIPTNGSVVDYAYSRIGCPYVWGASGPDQFDCSGLTMWCYAQIGISLPHYDVSQKNCAKAILNPEDAAPGDILWRSGHVAISTGGTNYIHAPHSGAVVCEGSGGRWTCALRF